MEQIDGRAAPLVEIVDRSHKDAVWGLITLKLSCGHSIVVCVGEDTSKRKRCKDCVSEEGT